MQLSGSERPGDSPLEMKPKVQNHMASTPTSMAMCTFNVKRRQDSDRGKKSSEFPAWLSFQARPIAVLLWAFQLTSLELNA